MASPPQESTLIGLYDGELDPHRYRSSYFTNKVGGQPDWLPGISRQAPRCGRCGAPLAHVAQVYCPMATSPYHRNLHLFACPGAECSGRSEGWRVLRSQCLETEAAAAAAAAQTPGRHAPAQGAPLSATDWCDTAEDWGMEEEEGGGGGGWGAGGVKDSQVQEEAADEGRALREADVSSRLQDLSLGESSMDVPAFRPFFISVVEESDLCGEDDDLEHAQELLREYERSEGAVAVAEPNGGEEKYEKTGARHGDDVFSRFMKKISLCPQQILRYCRSGKPLFVSKLPSNETRAAPACGSCGGPRTFELQLMPALVSLLQRTDISTEAELEFGTVLVYTCASSCWTAGSGAAVEEFCFVQADPDQQLFK